MVLTSRGGCEESLSFRQSLAQSEHGETSQLVKLKEAAQAVLGGTQLDTSPGY